MSISSVSSAPIQIQPAAPQKTNDHDADDGGAAAPAPAASTPAPAAAGTGLVVDKTA
ncbi:MAG: hypothetical protein P4M09_01965 [Devosia sp.]|nr:hypothetical protein [Devosia sp.]